MKETWEVLGRYDVKERAQMVISFAKRMEILAVKKREDIV